jgi:hypothetical protein
MQRAYKWVRMLFCACLLAVLLVAIESTAAPQLTGRATASSSQDTYRAEFAVHGDLNTRWIEPLPPKSQAILGGRGLRGSYCRGVCASGTASACTEHATRSIHLRLGPPAGLESSGRGGARALPNPFLYFALRGHASMARPSRIPTPLFALLRYLPLWS